MGGPHTIWSNPFDASPYRLMSFDFTATSTDSAAMLTLFIGSSIGDFKTYTLDAVSLAAVPESGAGVLLLAGLGWMARRRA